MDHQVLKAIGVVLIGFFAVIAGAIFVDGKVQLWRKKRLEQEAAKQAEKR